MLKTLTFWFERRFLKRDKLDQLHLIWYALLKSLQNGYQSIKWNSDSTILLLHSLHCRSYLLTFWYVPNFISKWFEGTLNWENIIKRKWFRGTPCLLQKSDPVRKSNKRHSTWTLSVLLCTVFAAACVRYNALRSRFSDDSVKFTAFRISNLTHYPKLLLFCISATRKKYWRTQCLSRNSTEVLNYRYPCSYHTETAANYISNIQSRLCMTDTFTNN